MQDGYTALMSASLDNAASVKELLASGADMEAKDNEVSGNCWYRDGWTLVEEHLANDMPRLGA